MKGRFGLLGHPITHSLSPEVHRLLHNYPYELFTNMTVDQWCSDSSVEAANVTAPYKREAFERCDWLSEEAKRTGVVNTLLKKNGKIYGWNTDSTGFLRLFKDHHYDQHKPVVILGNGATEASVRDACLSYGFASVTTFARKPRLNEKHFSEVPNVPSYVVHVTSLGANWQDPYPFDIQAFSSCLTMIDVRYSPPHSRLIRFAKDHQRPWKNGLDLLVYQAYDAANLLGLSLPSSNHLKAIIQRLYALTVPLILIGMPGVGKSTFAAYLSTRLSRPYFDLDTVIEQQINMKIAQFIRLHGEAAFREVEQTCLLNYPFPKGCIVATGGGTILSSINRDYLNAHGVVIYLKKQGYPLFNGSRPLTNSHQSYDDVKKIREPLYQAMADFTLEIQETIEETYAQWEVQYEHYFSPSRP